MSTPYPLLFEPLLKPRVWGGNRLVQLGLAPPDDEQIGESWEVADLPNTIPQGRSIVANGPLAGRTLRDAIASDPRSILGYARPSEDGGFPLLIKYLDAADNLSVQVHPDPDYVRRHAEAYPKSEAWVVIDAAPDAVIYKGLRPGLTREALARDIRSGRIVDDLIALPVRVGDCHYLPSGTCHALGGGLLVAEVQTPSDTTFRVYDWGRTGRELHIEQAIECIQLDSPPQTPPQIPVEVDGLRTRRLVETDFFAITRLDVLEPTQFEIVTNGLPMVWMFLAGEGRIDLPDGPPIQLRPGTTTLLPAALNGAVAVLEPRDFSLLEVTLPSPTQGLIA
jgi:mannose-6-phosphate isomerase